MSLLHPFCSLLNASHLCPASQNVHAQRRYLRQRSGGLKIAEQAGGGIHHNGSNLPQLAHSFTNAPRKFVLVSGRKFQGESHLCRPKKHKILFMFRALRKKCRSRETERPLFANSIYPKIDVAVFPLPPAAAAGTSTGSKALDAGMRPLPSGSSSLIFCTF